MTHTALLAELSELSVIPVLRLSTQAAGAQAIDCLLEAGFRTVEVTMTMPGALDLIADLRDSVDEGFLIGAGTVLDLDQAERCIEAGAAYLVSPCFVPGLAQAAREAECGVMMGGFTPLEVLAAWQDDVTMVKVFPAATGGPQHLRALHSIYPQIPLCPTGGVSLANMAEYFAAGARAVGVGNNIIDEKALAAGNTEQVIRHARAFLDLAAQARRPQ
jgi:2-dehydro-3-deoxyphosphogluconate aldolase/(4S)-4-hydroxy-2-oxoglutarate aldolase